MKLMKFMIYWPGYCWVRSYSVGRLLLPVLLPLLLPTLLILLLLSGCDVSNSGSIGNGSVKPAAITITTPLNLNAYVNLQNVSAYSLGGTCNIEGGAVSLRAGDTTLANTTCSAGVWTASLINFSEFADGEIALTAVITDLSKTAGPAVSKTASSTVVKIIKDLILPTPPTDLSVDTLMPSVEISPNIFFTAGADIGGSGLLKYQVQVILDSNPSTILKTWTDIANADSVSGLALTHATAYKIQAKAIDFAGNESSVATSNAWTVDIVGPTAGSISINGGVLYTTSSLVPLTLGATEASTIPFMPHQDPMVPLGSISVGMSLQLNVIA